MIGCGTWIGTGLHPLPKESQRHVCCTPKSAGRRDRRRGWSGGGRCRPLARRAEPHEPSGAVPVPPPVPAVDGGPGRHPRSAGRLPLPRRHQCGRHPARRRPGSDTVRPRRRRGLQGPTEPATPDPEPRARCQRGAGCPPRRGHGLRRRRHERRRLHRDRDRQRRQQLRRVGRHLRHPRQLRRRADPVGHLADLRGDRDQEGRCAPRGPRLRLRGVHRRHHHPQAHQGLRPLRPRGTGDRRRPPARLPVGGRERAQRVVLPLVRTGRRPSPQGHRQPARRPPTAPSPRWPSSWTTARCCRTSPT